MSMSALRLPAEMVTELALGMDPPYDVAERHGYTADELDILLDQDWFNKLVAERRVQLQDEGVTFQLKAALMAEETMTDLFKLGKSGQLNPSLLMDATKIFMQAAGMLNKNQIAASQGASGPAFQININVDRATIEEASTKNAKPHIIDGKAKVIEAPTLSIPIGHPLPPKPDGFKVPDFKLTPDLVGAPLPK